MRRPRRGSCRYGSLGLVGCLVAIAIPETALAESCHITAIPASPVTVGTSSNLTSGCTGTPTLIQWTSSLASCAPNTGNATTCNFPTAGTAHISVKATYAGSLGGSFTVSDHPADDGQGIALSHHRRPRHADHGRTLVVARVRLHGRADADPVDVVARELRTDDRRVDDLQLRDRRQCGRDRQGHLCGQLRRQLRRDRQLQHEGECAA